MHAPLLLRRARAAFHAHRSGVAQLRHLRLAGSAQVLEALRSKATPTVVDLGGHHANTKRCSSTSAVSHPLQSGSAGKHCTRSSSHDAKHACDGEGALRFAAQASGGPA